MPIARPPGAATAIAGQPGARSPADGQGGADGGARRAAIGVVIGTILRLQRSDNVTGCARRRGTVTRCRARAPQLRVRLLGPLEVVVGGRPVVVDTRKALAIVALVAAEGRPFARDELAAMFWPDADDEAARGALRRTLSALRTAIGPVGFVIERAQVALDPATQLVDLRRARATGRVGSRRATSRPPPPSPAGRSWPASPARQPGLRRLAGGPRRPGRAARWATSWIGWRRARSARRRRRPARSRPRGVGWTLDPLDEPGQRRVMELLARSGDRAGAIRQYRALVALFDRELGVAPLRETTELYEAIREDRRAGAGARGVRRASGPSPPSPARRSPTPDGRCATSRSSGASATSRRSTPRGAPRRRTAASSCSRARPGSARPASPRPSPPRSGRAAGSSWRLAATQARAPSRTGRSPSCCGPAWPCPTGLRAWPRWTRPPAPRSAGWSTCPRACVRSRPVDDACRTARRPGPPARGDRRGARGLDRRAGPGPDLGRRPAPGRRPDARGARLPRPPADAVVRCSSCSPGAARTWQPAARRRPTTSPGCRRRHEPRARAARPRRRSRPSSARCGRTDCADDALIDAFAADSEGLPLHVVAALASGEAPGQAMPRGVQALLRERICVGRRDRGAGPVGGGGHRPVVRPRHRRARRAAGPRRRRSRRSRS